MSKRFIAALLALSMCAGFAGCGSVSKGSKEAVNGKTSNTASNNDTTNEGKITILNNLKSENILYHDISVQDSDKPTIEEALMFAELALEQYNAAQSGDAEKYKQTLNFEKVLDSMADSLCISIFVDNSNKDIKSGIASLWGLMLMASADEDKIMDIEKARRSSAKDFDKLIKQLNEDFDPNALEMSLWTKRDPLYPLGNIDDKTIVRIFLYEFQRDENALEVYFNMDVINDEYITSLKNIDAWCIDGDIGLLIDDAERKINKFAGMTAEEIDQRLMYEENTLTAQMIYDFVDDYFAQKSSVGEDLKEVLETDFPMCSSSAGLDLRENEPEADGDNYIYSFLTITAEYNGTVSFGPLDEEKGMPEYVIYTAKDGTATKYPDNSED